MIILIIWIRLHHWLIEIRNYEYRPVEKRVEITRSIHRFNDCTLIVIHKSHFIQISHLIT